MKILKEKVINFLKWIKNECKDWRTLILLICVILTIYSTVWLGYLLYFIFKWNWCLVMASVTAAFWFGPFTPFFPLCIAITLSLKKIIQIKNNKIGENVNEKQI